jgi:hypothetical protein
MNGHEIHCKRRSQYVSKVSSIGYKKQGGPSTEPCGTPLCTLTGRLYDSPTLTQKIRSLKKALIHAKRFPDIPRCCSLEISRRLGTRSKALEKSKYSTSTELPLSTSLVQSARQPRRLDWIDLPGRKPCCCHRIKPQSRRNLTTWS